MSSDAKSRNSANHPCDDDRHEPGKRRVLPAAMLLLGCFGQLALAQGPTQTPKAAESTEQKVQRLSAAVEQVEAQMDAYQKTLHDLQRQLLDVQQQLSSDKAASPPTQVPRTADTTSQTASALEEIRERLGVAESQIATQDQEKVETESKYPLKVSGLVLLNSFVNTRAVDAPVDPTYALPGGGSTGLSVRQTVLGLDARGPHLFGATSSADVRVDFFAGGSQPSYANGGILRLRTAHARLTWKDTEAFFALDRPLFSPNTPTSLVAVAQPLFAWSGNLWTWNPQVGISHQIGLSSSTRLKLEAGLIDVANPQLPGTTPTNTTVSSAERSRWPGTEARIALGRGDDLTGPEFGVGGYFSPHENSANERFDAWAGTMDLRLPLPRHFQLTASAYRGQALGGLGAGGYVDYVPTYVGTTEYARALDDVGGWAQLKSKWGERLEFNGGYGIDNPFAGEVHALAELYEYDRPSTYPGLLRNRSAFGNVIYSPSTYLLFSLEYRQLWTNYASGSPSSSDAIGIGAGYRF